jgi:4'-phosphopantetheinyl transferase
MSLIDYIKVDDHSEIGILDLRLYLETAGLKEKRELEKEGAKFLLNELLEGAEDALYYDEFGKPHLNDMGRHMSLSHSHDKLAIILNKVEPTGIDIELVRDKVLNIKHKFLSPDELNKISDEEVDKMIVYWAVKESLYKIHGRKKVDFSRDLSVSDFDYRESGGEIKGKISLVDFNKSYLLHYEKRGEYILVYMIREIEKQLH